MKIPFHRVRRRKASKNENLGKKCFAFTKLDPADIRRIKNTAFHPA